MAENSFNSKPYQRNPKKPAQINQLPLALSTSKLEFKLKLSEEKFEKDKFLYQMAAGFEYIWETKNFSDFTVLADLKRFQVHKCVLSIRSPVFAAIFKTNMKESLENEMKIEEFSGEAVKEFLGYLYTNKYPRKENAMELFALASKYDVNQLRTTTEKIIVFNIKEENVIEIYDLGHLYNSGVLKTAAFTTIKEMFPMFNIPDSLIEYPETLKSLVGARRERDAKKDVVEGEYQAKVKALVM